MGDFGLVDRVHDSVVEIGANPRSRSGKPAMSEDNVLPFSLPAICRKKVSVAFDGGLLSSDGGVLVLHDVERRLGLAPQLARCLTDRRDPVRTDHDLIEMLRLQSRYNKAEAHRERQPAPPSQSNRCAY
jgi:hypothetical protein